MIIGLSGFAGVGKDSVASVLQQQGFAVLSFADPLKRYITEIFGFDQEDVWGASERRENQDKRYPRKGKTPEYLNPRYALQTLGTGWGRDCYQEIWVDYTIRVAREILTGKGYNRMEGLFPTVHPHKGVCISDCRYLNEIEGVKRDGGKVIRITRPGREVPNYTHTSETEQAGIPDSEFDAILVNDGALDDLPQKVSEILIKLR